MKKLLSVIVSLGLLFCMLPAVYAAGETVANGECGDQGDNLTWTLDEEGVLTVSGTGAMKDYGWNGSPWYQNAAITAVTVEEGVTTLGDYVLYGCTALEKVSLPQTLTSVGKYALCGCTSLKTLALPESVEIIGSGAFYGCTALTEVNIPEKITEIDNYVFCGCAQLPSVVFPQALATIGGSVFSGCTGLTELSLPAGLTTVGNAAFFGCTGLTEVQIPDSVTSLGRRAFSNCTGLEKATLGDGISAVPEELFFGCAALTEFTVPDGYNAVENGAFSGCSSLASVTLPAGILAVGDEAFSGCAALTEFPLPEGVASIGSKAFAGCDGFRYLTLPAALTSVGAEAFNGCRWLAGVVVPSALTEIGEDAFPAHTVIYGAPDAAAQQWAQANNRAYAAPSAAKLTLTGTAVVSEKEAHVGGFTAPCGSVVCYVNDTETLTVKAAADGKWNAALPLGDVNDGDTVVVKVTADAGEQSLSRELNVLYSGKAAAFRSLTLKHNAYQVTVDAADLNAAKTIVTLSEDKPLSFCVKVANSDRIETLYVASTRKNDVRKLALRYDAASDSWLGDGYFDNADHAYLPGAFSVTGQYKDGADFDAGVSVKVNFLIDPAGFAYEAVRDNKLGGVTAAVYYKDEAGRELLWNATSTEQGNPVTTLPDGAFSWAVHKGTWQIRLTKDGYQPAATEWMTVPPAQDQVFLPMVTTQAPEVESLNVYETYAEIMFSQYMAIDSVTEKTVVFDGCPGRVSPVDATQAEEGSEVSYATTFRFTPDVPFGENQAVTVSGVKNYAGIAMAEDYSAEMTPAAAPAAFTATDAVAVNYGDTAEIRLSAENGAGKAVTVSRDGSLTALDREEIVLDEKGEATVTVSGNMTGKETLTFTLAGTMLTAQTDVTVAMVFEAVPGDVDGDGTVSSNDARLALRISARLDPCEEGSAAFIAADVNHDGVIGPDDARSILRASARLEVLS